MPDYKERAEMNIKREERTTLSIKMRREEVAAIRKVAEEYEMPLGKAARKLLIGRLLKEGLLECTGKMDGFYKYKDIK